MDLGVHRQPRCVTNVVAHSTLANYWNVTLTLNGDAWEVEWSTAVLISRAVDGGLFPVLRPWDNLYVFSTCAKHTIKSIIVDFVKSYAVITSEDENTVCLRCNNGVNEWDITWSAEDYHGTVARFQAALAHCDHPATLAMSDRDSWIVWSSLKF